MVVSEVWKSRASVLIATLTTVVSRIDMMAPRTTTDATSSSPRSSLPSSLLGGAAVAVVGAVAVMVGQGSATGGTSSVSSMLPSRIQVHRQRLELVEERRLGRPRRSGELHPRVTREGLLEQDVQLQSGECGAEAEVPAARAERLVLRVAAHVEVVRVLVAGL